MCRYKYVLDIYLGSFQRQIFQEEAGVSFMSFAQSIFYYSVWALLNDVCQKTTKTAGKLLKISDPLCAGCFLQVSGVMSTDDNWDLSVTMLCAMF